MVGRLLTVSELVYIQQTPPLESPLIVHDMQTSIPLTSVTLAEHDVKGGLLTIDCRGCSGPSLPSDIRCLRCICFKIIDLEGVDRALLRRDVDRVLMGDGMVMVRDLAHIIGSLFSCPEGSFLCRGCHLTREALRSEVWVKFPEMPEAPRTPPRQRSRCGVCVSKARSRHARASMMHRSLVNRLSGAYPERRRVYEDNR